jgi:multisubunit Na+/H+ antiporter MnhC subunit
MSRYFLLLAFGFATLGLVLGLYMGIRQNHGQLVTHAHIMLVGFVLTLVYALCHRLWLGKPPAWLAKTQLAVHLMASLVFLSALFMLYAQWYSEDILGPVLGLSGIGVLLALLLMFWMLFRHPAMPSE